MKKVIENILALIVWYAILLLWGDDWAMQIAIAPFLFIFIFWLKSFLKKKFLKEDDNDLTRKDNKIQWLIIFLALIIFLIIGITTFLSYSGNVT